jgi:glutamate/aspartate transport system substrate-binding protein
MKKTSFAILCALSCALSTAATAADTLGRIKSAKSINVAYSPDSLPFSFSDNGAPVGYSIDLCKRVIAQIGRAVGVPNLDVKWMPAQTPERLKMVASGKADLECANTSQTLARLADVDFSALIFLDTGSFLARAGSTDRLMDMGGRKIAVLKGTTTEVRLRDALQKRLVNAEVVTIDKPEDGLAMLESGKVDLFAGDRIKLVGLAARAKDPTKFSLSGDEISYEPYAFALPRNDSAMRLEVNRALSQVYRSGEIGQIFQQWLGALGKPPDLIMAMYILYVIPD